MLTPDLLKHLKSLAKNSQLVTKQTISDSLVYSIKDTFDLQQAIKRSMVNDLANFLLKDKASIISGPINVDRFGKEYKAVVWGFTSNELDNFITQIYEAGLNAKEIY